MAPGGAPYGEHLQQVVPAARGAGLDDVSGELVGSGVQLGQLLGGADAAPVGGKAGAEHIGDQAQLVLATDRAGDTGRAAHVASGADELGVGIANLVLAQTAATELVDQMAAREAVVDDPVSSQHTDVERHGR